MEVGAGSGVAVCMRPPRSRPHGLHADAGEDSYSHHADEVIGVPIIDRFTFYLAHFLCGLAPGSNATLQDLADYLR